MPARGEIRGPLYIGDILERALRRLVKSRIRFSRFPYKDEFVDEAVEDLKEIINEALEYPLDEIGERARSFARQQR